MEAQDDEEQFFGAFKIMDNQQDAGNLPETEFLFDPERMRDAIALEETLFDHVNRPPKRSPPMNIVRNESCSEPIAELFPTDSDYSWSTSSISRPSSICSDNLNMSGTGSQGNAPSLGSLDEQTKKNSSKIENMQKGTSRRAIKMKDKMSKICKMMTDLIVRVDQLEKKAGKEEEYSDSHRLTQKHLPQSMNSCLSWVVPYSDLKRQSAQSIISPELKLPWLQGLKATLYLLGIENGHGSHLSIGFSWPKKGENPKVAESYPVDVTVQIIDQEDASESIEKRLLLVTCQEDGGSSAKSSNLNTSIPKLIPISTVEDTSLGYLSDGRLLINISIEDILV